MPFHQPDSIRYYIFDSLTEAGVTHAVFTRRGGASPAPWDSLNVGATVGDDLENVSENRVRSFEALGRNIATLTDTWLVHGREVLCATEPRDPEALPPQADVLLTDQPLTLFMRFADCVPILLYDPRRKVVGMAHAGWPGTVKQAAKTAVEAMQAQYHSRPEDLLAAIGPSIGPHHYEIGPDVIVQVEESFGSDASALLPEFDGSTHFDLWSANRLILEQAGVTHIEVSQICTACHLDDWYSHRGDHGSTGRFGALIALNV